MTGTLRLLACIRYREVVVLQGPPAMGVVLAMGEPTLGKAALGALLLFANACLVAHMWSLNDWADRHADEGDERKSRHVFTRKGVAPAEMLTCSFGLLGVSLVLFAGLGTTPLKIALGLTALSLLYSWPGLHLKRIALLASAPHLVGGLLHFLLGYSLFAPIGPDSLRIAVAFALIFTAGHGVQEVQDHDADRRAGLRTSAVVFGKRAVFGATLVAFLVGHGLLAHLSASGAIPRPLGPLVLALAGLHLVSAGQALHADLSFECVRLYRERYRALFALLGLTLTVTRLA